MCGCGQDGPHFIRLSDFVNKLKLDLRKRVAKKGSIDTVAAILSAANVDAIATTATIGGNWCKRNNVLNNKGKVASMLPPGVVFGWVDRVDGEAAVGGALDTRVLEAASEGDGADDATPLGQEVTANALLTLASAQPSLLVLILNLDRRSDRLEALRAQSGMQRLRCERVQAVDGASSSWEGLAPVLTPTALEDARWAELHRVPTLCRATESFSPYHTRASAACAATHKKAWERLEASSCDVALILEDDARVAPDLADAVQQVLGALEQHPFWKVCHLGTHEGGIKLKGANKRAALADELEQGEVRTGLAGYLVRRSDVRELLDGVFPLDEQLDVALSQHSFGHGARYELSSRAQLVVSPPSQDGTTDVQTFGDARCHDHLPPRMASRVLTGRKRRWSLRDQLQAANRELRQLRGAPRAATSDDDAASREERRALAAWKGRRYAYHGNVALEIKFDDRPPYGVAAPPMAVAGLGDSLRCARGKLDVSTLAAALDALPRTLSWGRRGDAEMARSKRKYFHLTPEAIELAVRGGDGVPRRALSTDLKECDACMLELAARVKALMGLDGDLLGMQANYQHTEFPQHTDDAKGDGFGACVATANVRGIGRVVVCEKECTEINHMWWFDLAPGDVWAMRDYVRWECTHGLPLMQTPAMPCGPGCGCRISLNCRFGVRSALE